MSQSLTSQAERAYRQRDPGRAVALARHALALGEPRLPALRLATQALVEILSRTGVVRADLSRGPTRPRILREGSHASAVIDVVAELQRMLYGLAGEREATAFERIFRLAGALSDADVVRQPRSGEARPIVLSMLCCERPELLQRTLADLLASDLEPSELVFFEDASRDAMVLPLLEQLDAGAHRVHVIANRGFATRSWPANQNAVLDYARRELGGFESFVTCDADMALGRGWWSSIRELQRVLDNRRLPEGRLGVTTAFHAEQSHPALRETVVDGVRLRIKETVGGCQLVVPRTVLDGVLGRLDHRSDWGWSSRLRAAGLFVAATSPSRCQHLGEASMLFHSRSDQAADFVPA